MDRVEAWQRRLEETFTGPSGIVGERLMALNDHEQSMKGDLLKTYAGYVCLLDSFLDFFLHTFEQLAKQNASVLTEEQRVTVGICVPTLWRFRSSYLMFWKGYVVDAMSNLRGVFENILAIAAMKHGAISPGDFFGGLQVSASKGWTEEQVYAAVKKNTQRTDGIIYDFFFGAKSDLSIQNQKALQGIWRLLHNAVHKSKMNIFLYSMPWIRGEKGLPIYPPVDVYQASMYTNLSIFFGWMVVKLLPLIQPSPDGLGKEWNEKQKILDESFSEATKAFWKDLGRTIEALIEKRFTF